MEKEYKFVSRKTTLCSSHSFFFDRHNTYDGWMEESHTKGLTSKKDVQNSAYHETATKRYVWSLMMKYEELI